LYCTKETEIRKERRKERIVGKINKKCKKEKGQRKTEISQTGGDVNEIKGNRGGKRK